MEMDEILIELTAIYREVLNNAEVEITENMAMGDFDSWDSIAQMLLIANIEEKFSVKFKLKEVNALKMVGDIVQLIATKLA